MKECFPVYDGNELLADRGFMLRVNSHKKKSVVYLTSNIAHYPYKRGEFVLSKLYLMTLLENKIQNDHVN